MPAPNSPTGCPVLLFGIFVIFALTVAFICCHITGRAAALNYTFDPPTPDQFVAMSEHIVVGRCCVGGPTCPAPRGAGPPFFSASSNLASSTLSALFPLIEI
jgi:hypothetical protein